VQLYLVMESMRALAYGAHTLVFEDGSEETIHLRTVHVRVATILLSLKNRHITCSASLGQRNTPVAYFRARLPPSACKTEATLTKT
jgi:hypothetical protein